MKSTNQTNKIKKSKLKTYYLLELDSYNQPSGIINEIELTKSEYDDMKSKYIYIYENYSTALMRAQN